VWDKHPRSAKRKRSMRGKGQWQTPAGVAVLCIAALMLVVSFVIGTGGGNRVLLLAAQPRDAAGRVAAGFSQARTALTRRPRFQG
jgi:hypothetical protein